MSDKKRMLCPKDDHYMKLAHRAKKVRFRDTLIEYSAECYRCPDCGTETATIPQAAQIQKSISDAYREKEGLLTGQDIVRNRKELKLSQQELAHRIPVGIASIKRWEGTAIQTKSMDRLLRNALQGRVCGDPYTGNRELSKGRIKMLLSHFEFQLNRKILKKGDRLLYAAKYAWYTDMLAFRERGEGITGATYAALPNGPQINNYKDLIDDIINADISAITPLTDEEKRFVERVARTFPRDNDVYKAVHDEPVWKEKMTGALIPYTDAERLTKI